MFSDHWFEIGVYDAIAVALAAPRAAAQFLAAARSDRPPRCCRCNLPFIDGSEAPALWAIVRPLFGGAGIALGVCANCADADDLVQRIAQAAGADRIVEHAHIHVGGRA